VLLCSEAASGEARERLAFLEESSDGFAIAEKDLELRGPGDLLGSRQSGIPGFWIADPIADVEELRAARAEISRRRTRKQTSASDLFPRGHAVIETGSEIQEEQQG
jgi:RecG-like helicase